MLTLLLYMGCAMSRGWLFRIGLFGLCLALSLWQTDFSAVVLWERGGRFISMTGEMFPPDVTFFRQILETLRDTLCTSLAGTGLGAVLGAVGTLLCNSYVNRRKGMRIFLKTVVHVFRCIPVLILALLCTFLFGLGVWAGVVAITISTGAVLARLGYEDSESSDLETTYVLEYTGAGRVKAWFSSVWNQIFPGYLSNVLYILESNVRNAAILGFVGAGGIGLLLNEKLAWREYSKVGAILCALYIVVSACEFMSEYLRKKILYEKRGGKITFLPFFLLFFPALLLLFIWNPLSGEMNLVAFTSIIKGVVSPDITILFSLQGDDVPALLLETLCVAFLGTVGGTLFALFFSVFACFRFFGKTAFFMRMLLLVFRAVPVLVFGLLWIRVTGPGPFAGVLTLALCSVGFLAKRFLIAIDAIDLHPYQALRASGVTVLPAVRWGIVPQILPHYVSAILYRLDINLRETAVLGLVGAGGVGTTLFLAMNHYEWNQAGAMLWGLVLLVAAAGGISETYRKRFRMRNKGK